MRAVKPLEDMNASLTFCIGLRVPGPSAAETFFKFDDRLIAEDFSRERDVGLRIADVAGARRFVLRLNFFARDFFDEFYHLVESDTRAGAAVEDLSGGAFGIAGAKSFVHDVVDEGEVA